MTTNTHRAGRREWLGLAVLVLPTILISMDLTVLHLAVPHLSSDLRPTSTELLWIVDVYGFMIAGLLIPMGALGDRIGRRRLLLIGGVAFALASALAAASSSPAMLIATRALLGVAGATLLPSTLALIRNMFADPRERTTAVSMWMMGFMVGGAIGPLAGGAILEWFDWRAVFLLAVPVMLVLVAAGPALVPEYRDPDPGPFDLRSAAMSLAAVLLVVQGVKHAAEHGVDGMVALCAVAGVAIGALFVRRQRRLRDPLLDLALFRNSRFSVSILVTAAGLFVLMGASLFVAQDLQLVRGLSPVEAGLWLLPQTVAAIAGASAAPALARRLRPAVVLAGGMLIAAGGFALMASAQPGDGLAPVIGGLVIASFGTAPVLALGTELVLSSAPAERAGAASAVSETGNELGGALGIALMGSAGTAVYRADVEALPAGVPDGVAAAVGDTLGSAVDAAQALSPALAADVLAVAQDAFTSGMQAAMLLAAAVAAAMAVAAWIGLRGVGVHGAEAEGAAPIGDAALERV